MLKFCALFSNSAHFNRIKAKGLAKPQNLKKNLTQRWLFNNI